MEVAHIDSPLGGLEICAEDGAIIAITFQKGSEKSSDPLILQCIKELEDYFSGNLKNFSVPIRLRGTEFQNRVWKELIKIPHAKTINYSELAVRLGDLKCIRAAGTANGKNKIPIIIPCHRVIGKDGSLVGFAGGLDRKRWLLKHEGIIRGEQVEIFG